MRPNVLLSVSCVLLLAAGPAQGIVLFLDTGGLSDGVQAGPLDNSNPNLFVIPGRTITLHLWGIPAADDDRVVVTLGHDIRITGTATNAITTTAYTIENPVIETDLRWSGTRLVGGLNTPGSLVNDQRAVFVPTSAPFLGGVGSGFLASDPGFDAASGAVYLARLDLAVDAQATFGTSAELRLAISSLLIANATTATPGDEPVSFGFDGAGPEAATGSGSVSGATSTLADAILTVTSLGDADADGEIGLDDFAALGECLLGPAAASDANCGLFDQNGDGHIDLADFQAFQAIFSQP